MATLKELASRGELLTGGHRACPGCGGSIIFRQVLAAAGPNTVCGICTGCMEVVTTIFPYTAWGVPYIHCAFENSAATVSGVETAYRALTKKGKLEKGINFIAFGGDGGTYDIGFQALSGAAERGHKMLYVCYDNQAYMNTGIQRSSATPRGAHTTTSPAGTVIPGKEQGRKDITEAMVAHKIPYVAQAAPGHWKDLTSKVERALKADGFSFINVLSPCPLGWRCEPEETIEISKLAVDTCFWPLYEVEDGVYKINYRPKEKPPLREWMEKQGRFRHLFAKENAHILDENQREADEKWERLLKLSELSRSVS